VYGEADRLGLARAREELGPRYEACVAALRAPLDGAPERLPADLIVNDLQPAALSLCPSIAAGLEAALSAGADDALVCGSGPTVAGLFWGADGAERAAAAAASLGDEFAGATSAVPVGAEFGLPVFA
jgi:4-diphosphocytidyl-2-C-methyl-D-erythritol kinase